MGFSMKKSVPFLLLGVLAAEVVFARNDRVVLPVKPALDLGTSKGKLDPGVKFYFSGETRPEVSQTLLTVKSNRKTNALNKDDEEACNWTFLSAMMALQQRAKKEGGDAVIDIQSYYDHDVFKSKAQFVCSAGAVIAGVVLEGSIVKLK